MQKVGAMAPGLTPQVPTPMHVTEYLIARINMASANAF